MFDIMSAVTDRIINALEQGTAPWVQPWTGSDAAIKHKSGEEYSLLNQLLLPKGGEYLSFKEAEAEGGHVKKGAKGHMVVFWKIIGCEDTDDQGDKITKTIPILRYYTVFHIDDCEGIKPKHTKVFDTKTIDNPEAVLDEYTARCRVKLEKKQSGQAYYSPREHRICLPRIEPYKDAHEYYSTAFQEAVHSTGHHTLLDRFPENAMAAAFGSESYSKEELIAEIGACAILGKLGIETADTFRNSAAYIQGWLRALKNDKKLIVSAAGKAQKAVSLILNEQTAEA